MVVSILTQKMPSFRGITLGTLISGLALAPADFAPQRDDGGGNAES